MKRPAATAFALLMMLIGYSQSSTLSRPNDPIILIGTDVPTFLTLNTNSIVGFKYSNNAWTQIPVQVDERALLDIVTPYGPLAAMAGYPPTGSNPKLLFYTDATSYVGADPVSTFDADDEIVFMAKDAGGQFAGANYPAGIVTGSCREIRITDPLGGVGYVYLFQNAGSLSQDAGTSYVSYNFNVTGTGFPAHLNGLNNENSTITTSKYSWHFSAEWISDELKLALGTNVDILDRYKNFYANGNCIRSEDTFSSGENAYITNKNGPVRAIRSYMGANSGPLTQRTHLFYQGRQDIVTDMRVHNIVSVVDAFDYNSNASGMTYRNSLNTTGVVINGVQDNLTAGNITWEMVSGAQGSLVILQRKTTTLTASEATVTSYYDDNSTSPGSNCTGDGQAWGTSGTMVNFLNGSVCTDPMASGCAGSQWYRTLQVKRVLYAEAPNAAASVATAYNNQYDNPLQISVNACPATTVTAINPVNGLKALYAISSGTKLLFQNLSDDEVYAVSVFNSLGQLIAKGKVSKANPSMEVNGNGIISVMISGRKSTTRFQLLMAN